MHKDIFLLCVCQCLCVCLRVVCLFVCMYVQNVHTTNGCMNISLFGLFVGWLVGWLVLKSEHPDI